VARLREKGAAGAAGADRYTGTLRANSHGTSAGPCDQAASDFASSVTAVSEEVAAAVAEAGPYISTVHS
jgi:hypothetical protein